MTRIATMVTTGLLAGGMLWAPGEARACEAHAKQAAAAKGQQPAPEKASGKGSEADTASRPLDELDQLLSAKCSCGSKADCTCKKGKCECSKCNGRHEPRQVMDSLRERPARLDLREARYDASAGIFI